MTAQWVEDKQERLLNDYRKMNSQQISPKI
jgi:hypothetical protein